LLAVLALAIGGAGAFLYAWMGGQRARPEPVAVATPVAPGEPASRDGTPAPPPAPSVTSGDGPVATEMPQDAAAAMADAAVVATPATASPDDAAPAEPPREVATGKQPAPSAPRQGSTTRRTGPPGFVTIDSEPYAVISIDGKSHGETPLVKVELAPGRHTVRAKLPSGATREVRILIEPGKEAPTVRFAWKPAELEPSPP
jgi:hypothetical protein